MARKNEVMTDESAPAPANGTPTPWTPPDGDQEFVFDTIQSAPEWVDRGWASFDRGPALAVPAGDLYSEGPYTTLSARPGDTVKFVAGKGSMAPHIEVIKGEVPPEKGTKRIAQQSAAQEEDLLKGGFISPDDLGEDAKAQIIGRSPKLRGLIEGTTTAPEAQKVGDILKTS